MNSFGQVVVIDRVRFLVPNFGLYGKVINVIIYTLSVKEKSICDQMDPKQDTTVSQAFVGCIIPQ